jgi:hypothetical protein
LAGCADSPAPSQDHDNPIAPAGIGEDFDEAATGTIRGTVLWQGELPKIAPFKVHGLPGDYPVDVRKEQPNPNAPRIDPATLAMADVVVFLRGVDLKKSRPWDHPPVAIEQRDRHLLVRQGEASSNVGWVRLGDTIEVTNYDSHFHMLRGRGASFFSLPLPQPNLPSRRRLDKPGVVELSSGAFFFWMHGYLLVDRHPYHTRTNARGEFALEKVPAGSYDVVCWLPNWTVATTSRDPETGFIIQADFAPPLEQVCKMTVTAGQTQRAAFVWPNK